MPKTSINSRIKKYAYCDIEQIYKEIDASPDGLSYDQIKVKRNQYGSNSFTKNDDTFLYCIYRAFINPFNIKLLFCKWVVIIRLFTMFRAHCISISHFFWRQNCHFYKF